MAIASISILQNPVTLWEQYSYNLYPKGGQRGGIFFDFDRTIEAENGYGRCRFKFSETKAFLGSFFENGLGRDIRVYNHKGKVDYHGFILAMSLNTGHHALRLSMQNLANCMWARYDASDGVNPTQRSTVYQNAASKARFGHCERVIGGGQQASIDEINQAVQTKLKELAWPQIDPDFGAGGGEPYIEISAVGYYHTLQQRVYNQTAAGGDANLSVVATDVIAKCGLFPYGFIKDHDIAANTTQVPREFDTDRNAKDILESLAAMGDVSGNRSLSRVEVDRHYTLQRVVSQSGDWGVAKYFVNVWEPLKFRSHDGVILDPDEIPVNEWIFMEGVTSIGSKVYSDGNLENPNMSFLESASYRMETDTVRIKATKESMLSAVLKKLGGVSG